MKGKFITFEGCEGVGKSKQVKLLAAYLNNKGIQPLILREPGGTTISEGIRELILDPKNNLMTAECELILYIAARAQLIREKIKPALDKGIMVICDRFIDSTVAYQGFGRNLGPETVNALNKIAIADCIPDCTIFLDLTPELAFRRKGGADKGDRLELEDMDFHNRVYEGYKYAEKTSGGRIVTISPTGSVEDTHNKIIKALKEKGIIGR